MADLKNTSINSIVKKKKTVWFLALLLVVLLWGLAPINTNYLLKYTSPSAYATAVGVIAFLSLLLINCKKLHLLSFDYFKIAVPIGLVLAIAEILQKIGLPYTTPARYAFLENLSCVVVPILTYAFTKVKPTIFKILGAVLCIVGSFILSGVNLSSGTIGIGIGEILCALAGFLYGVNISATGAFSKKLDSSLYVMIQMGVYAVAGVISSLIMSMPVFGGSLEENFSFCFEPLFLILLIGGTLLTSTLCWILRTHCMKYIDATVIAVVAPCSAVITGFVSVLTGTDTFSVNLLLGGIIAVVAVIISGIEPKKRKTNTPTFE